MVVLNYSDGSEPARYTGRNALWYAVAQDLKAQFIPESFRNLTSRRLLVPTTKWVVVLSEYAYRGQVLGIYGRTLFYWRKNVWLRQFLYPRKTTGLLDRIFLWPLCPPTHRVRIGDPEFDLHGYLRCSDPPSAKELFAEPLLRMVLLSNAPGELSISPRKDHGVALLSFCRIRDWKGERDLYETYSTTAMILQRLVEIGWAEKDAPDSLGH